MSHIMAIIVVGLSFWRPSHAGGGGVAPPTFQLQLFDLSDIRNLMIL